MFTFVYKMKNPEGNGDQISNLPLYRHAGVVIGSLVYPPPSPPLPPPPFEIVNICFVLRPFFLPSIEYLIIIYIVII